MGLKKYEIITVGSDKRVRALRSWQVGDRYVNIGDVGGIVYDEKTLSQDGACWLFKGNFGFPGARIGGDSIVDVGETTLHSSGTPNVDILGSSVVVGGPLKFEMDKTATDAVVLNESFFEQGDCTFAVGSTPNDQKISSPNVIRLKDPIFMGGVAKTVKLSVPGFSVTIFGLDRDLRMVSSTPVTETGEGITLTIPASQYCYVRLRKNPLGVTVPADATTAAIAFTGTYDTKISVIDSRVEINPANNTGAVFLKSGGTYQYTTGAKYPEAIIRNSKVSINMLGAASIGVRIMGQFIGSTATLDGTASLSIAGIYSNIKNLTVSGVLESGTGVDAYNIIQATDCDNLAVSPTIFPGMTAARTANMPFIFQGCNVPNGLFYHHAQIANTYKNIDFAKAQTDLGKSVPGVAYTLVSSETEGMYRIYNTAADLLGFLVESYDSISSIGLLAATATSYGTTIYKDAYVSGKFDFAGTNVFGHKVRSHPLAQVLNVQPRAVQGDFNTSVVGQIVTGIVQSSSRVSIPTPVRANGATGFKIDNIPNGVNVSFVFVNPANNAITVATGWSATSGSITVSASYLKETTAFLRFRKTGDVDITPEDLAGITVTVYNGCKIVNTGATAVNMKGNIRVEDNAALINASVTGSGYFGGNSVASGLLVEGSAFMSDNASFTKTVGVGVIGNLKMKDNGIVVLGDVTGLGVLSVTENARLQPTNLFLSEADLIMSGNALVTAGLNISGILRLKDNAKVTAGAMTAKGDITVCGSYSQSTTRRWFGKRVIDNENAPEYDNNVKTQYDF
nr:MAG TPA: Putative transferase, nesg, ydcK, Structural Genomics.38A [Caudoviricetes sp.]